MKKSSKELGGEILRFVTVGIFNTIIGFGIFNIFASNIIGLQTPEAYFLCNALTFILVMIISLFFNSRFTFKEKDLSGKSIWRFAVVTTVAFALSNSISVEVFRIFRTYHSINTLIIGNISAVIGVAVGMCVNFLGYKLFVFRRYDEHY